LYEEEKNIDLFNQFEIRYMRQTTIVYDRASLIWVL